MNLTMYKNIFCTGADLSQGFSAAENLYIDNTKQKVALLLMRIKQKLGVLLCAV